MYYLKGKTFLKIGRCLFSVRYWYRIYKKKKQCDIKIGPALNSEGCLYSLLTFCNKSMCLWCCTVSGAMAFFGTAALRVMVYRQPLTPLCRATTRCYSSQSTPITEKSVPYEKTLKQEYSLSGPTKPLPKSADVVVIGGGSLGCQTLYHLCKLGMTNVVLLERDRLTAGTTWHTAGIAVLFTFF